MAKILLSENEFFVDPTTGKQEYKRKSIDSNYPWPPFHLLQGGEDGIVIVANGKNYKTAFVEILVDHSLIRGEGKTLAEAELSCWNKYLNFITCNPHNWEAKHYVNGTGVCSKCSIMKSNVFTGEQLGQYCSICNVGTTYHQELLPQPVWYCREHEPLHKERQEFKKICNIETWNLTAEERLPIIARYNELIEILGLKEILGFRS
jgi:hypothetical protein